MRKNQIIYFLNAVYYGIWTINMKFGDFIGRSVEAIRSPVPKYLFSKSCFFLFASASCFLSFI